MKVAIYVHIPFCQARCAYCDFNTYAGLETLIPAYVTAVRREIEIAGERWGHLTVPTIYFGGGTPSILPPDLLDELLHALRFTFHVSRDAEITLEANPGTVSADDLRRLRTLGVNRLSLGVQSAHDDELCLLGRIHTWAEAVGTVKAARAAGFDNLSLDFIFGLPGQTLARWGETLNAALALSPEHLSLYCLTIEEDTSLARQIAESQIAPPDPDLAADMYELAEKTLAEARFFHYEISNWARSNLKSRISYPKSYVCRHNLTYWRNEPWLGIGAGAYSWLVPKTPAAFFIRQETDIGGVLGLSKSCFLADRQRWANVSHPREYITALRQGNTLVAEIEPIDRQMEMGETMMMGLRLAEGVDDARFRARFDVGLETAFGAELGQLQDLGLLTWDGHVARLTPRGRLLGNQVFMRFV